MLEAQNLAARRGFADLFAGITFRLEAGEALLVTGANGSGKTTLLRMMAGLSSPAAGQIRWNGRPTVPFDPEHRAVVAYAGHLPALKDELSAEENLASLVALDAVAVDRSRTHGALDAAGLLRQRNLPARVLSQGQRRRIGLARLTLLPRPLWILDEPATALDASGAALLTAIISGQLARRGIVIAATHVPLGLPSSSARTLSLD